MQRRRRPTQAQTRAPAKIEIEHDLITRLRPEAARREVSVDRLIRDLRERALRR
jgi:hypothetical protein